MYHYDVLERCLQNRPKIGPNMGLFWRTDRKRMAVSGATSTLECVHQTDRCLCGGRRLSPLGPSPCANGADRITLVFLNLPDAQRDHLWQNSSF